MSFATSLSMPRSWSVEAAEVPVVAVVPVEVLEEEEASVERSLMVAIPRCPSGESESRAFFKWNTLVRAQTARPSADRP